MIKHKYIRLLTALLCAILLSQVSILAQNQKSVVVKDENGNPIAGVKVTVGETGRPVFTNEKGEFMLQADIKTPVLFEADGYEPQIIMSTPPVGIPSVMLLKSPYQLGSKDQVNVPFGSFRKRLIPGAVSDLNPTEILNYDQLESYAGALNGRIPGMFGSSEIRQLGNALVVVDGIPRSAADFNLQQIEKITVVKDLASAILYGGQANNGVILITTKRGSPLKRELHFTARAGMDLPISYPKFLPAADYMRLYNEALANDGLPAKYSPEQIDATASGSDPIQYPDQEYYNSTYLKDWASSHSLIGEASGGNEIAQYYLNIGWNRNTGLLKLGEGEKTDRINMRGNVNYKLTDKIKIRVDGSAIFSLNNGPRYTSSDFWTLSSTTLPDLYPVVIPVDLLKDKSLLGSAKPVNGYLIGGTKQYMTNLYGDLTLNGPRQQNSRMLNFNMGLEADLSSITPGLKASGLISFDMYSWFLLDIMNSYAVYQPVYKADTISSWVKNGTDNKVNNQTLTDANFYRKIGAYGTLDYNRSFGNHEVTVNAVAYRDMYSTEYLMQPTKHLNFGLRANYVYKNRYIAELSGLAAGSVKLYETHPWGFSPAIGLAWVMSEEDFLKNNSLINYLKVRTNFARNNTDESLNSYYIGRNVYSSSSSYTFNQGSNYNNGRIILNGNPDLRFEKRMNFNLGFESMLLDYKLGFEASYFYYKSYDVITKRLYSLPAFFTGLPYENFGSYKMQGVEAGLNYTAKVGDLQIRIGGNMAYVIPKAVVVDELNYKDDYRKLAGKPTDAMFGWVALGLFKDQAEIDDSPFQTFGTVKPGDIKYQDLNNDGVINDLDQKQIGNYDARVEYSLNIDLKYKNFELFALGSGQAGADRYFNNSYYWVYGTRKYSEAILGRWTPENADAVVPPTYPRLTTLSSSNNFRNSTFWLEKYNWFTLHTVQLTYKLPVSLGPSSEIRVFLRSNNLFMLSKIKDKAQLNIGSAPQTRSVSMGLSLML